MAEERLPPSMRLGASVTEEEFLKARLQQRILWGRTIGGSFAVFFLIMYLNMKTSEPANPLLFSLISRPALFGLLSLFLKEAFTMSTARMRQYRELRRWRATRKKMGLD